MYVLMSESFIQPIHSNGWFIQKLGKWLSSWMGHWIIDSHDSFKHVDSFSNKTPLCCSETHNSSAVALIATISVGKIEQKLSILGLKSKSLNFNLLLIEILLYKISVTMQSCWYCYSRKHHGRLMLLTLFFFFYAVCIYTFLRVTLCVLSLSHSLRLCKPHLAWHKYIISHHLHWMPLKLESFSRATTRLHTAPLAIKRWDWPAGHRSGPVMQKIILIPITGRSIGASLVMV